MLKLFYVFVARFILILHLAFIVYVIAGGLLVLRWKRSLWLHLPCVTWGAGISFFGWICPLTPLENYFLELAYQSGYSGSFIDRYLLSTIYPSGLTPFTQVLLGIIVLAINTIVYGYYFGSLNND